MMDYFKEREMDGEPEKKERKPDPGHGIKGLHTDSIPSYIQGWDKCIDNVLTLLGSRIAQLDLDIRTGAVLPFPEDKAEGILMGLQIAISAIEAEERDE